MFQTCSKQLENEDIRALCFASVSTSISDSVILSLTSSIKADSHLLNAWDFTGQFVLSVRSYLPLFHLLGLTSPVRCGSDDTVRKIADCNDITHN